jgi:hypothetical protein
LIGVDVANRMFRAFAEWQDGAWRAVSDEIEGRQFVATAPSEISDPNDRESLEPVKEKLRQDLLHQLEETLGYPRESTGIIVAFVE